MQTNGSDPNGSDAAVSDAVVSDAAEPATSSVVCAGRTGVPLTVSRPDGPIRGGVIVVQEAWGVNDHIASVTDKVAAQGYLAVAPHLYHRSGDQVVAEFAAARPLMAQLNGADLTADLGDALDFVTGEGVDGDRIGIVGFCMGGTVALWAAATLPVAAAVTFYGSGIREPRWPGVPAGLELASRIRAPWLGFYGDTDRSIPVDDVEALRSALGSAGVAATIVRYPNAGHAFATDPASSNHVPEAARDAWTRTFGWFDAHLR